MTSEGPAMIVMLTLSVTSKLMGIDIGSYTDISPQTEVFTSEAICRFYQEKHGRMILVKLQRIGLILL